jgi:rubrerythrin
MSKEMVTGSRRGVLSLGAGALSAVGALALFDRSAMSAGAPRTDAKHNPAQDVNFLNAAVALEHEAIGVYQIGADSKLLLPDILKVALTFQGQHKQHRDDLAAAIKRLGGDVVQAKAIAEYAKQFDTSALKNQSEVLRLALKLERGATNAYLGLVPSLDLPDLDLLIARNAADESFHVAVLGNVLGEPIPEKAPMFG